MSDIEETETKPVTEKRSKGAPVHAPTADITGQAISKTLDPTMAFRPEDLVSPTCPFPFHIVRSNSFFTSLCSNVPIASSRKRRIATSGVGESHARSVVANIGPTALSSGLPRRLIGTGRTRCSFLERRPLVRFLLLIILIFFLTNHFPSLSEIIRLWIEIENMTLIAQEQFRSLGALLAIRRGHLELLERILSGVRASEGVDTLVGSSFASEEILNEVVDQIQQLNLGNLPVPLWALRYLGRDIPVDDMADDTAKADDDEEGHRSGGEEGETDDQLDPDAPGDDDQAPDDMEVGPSGISETSK